MGGLLGPLNNMCDQNPAKNLFLHNGKNLLEVKLGNSPAQKGIEDNTIVSNSKYSKYKLIVTKFLILYILRLMDIVQP